MAAAAAIRGMKGRGRYRLTAFILAEVLEKSQRVDVWALTAQRGPCYLLARFDVGYCEELGALFL